MRGVPVAAGGGDGAAVRAHLLRKLHRDVARARRALPRVSRAGGRPGGARAPAERRRGRAGARRGAASRGARRVARARAGGGAAAFLRVGAEAWTREEADNFREGAGYYDGAARDAFCASVGLTRALVAEAGREQLETAALNLGLPLGEAAEGARAGRAARTSELRRRLWLFLCWNYRGARL